MKRCVAVFILFFVLISSFDLSGQNLIRNGGFEEFSHCVEWNADSVFIQGGGSGISNSVLEDWTLIPVNSYGIYINNCFYNPSNLFCQNQPLPLPRTGAGNALMNFRFSVIDYDTSIYYLLDYYLTTSLICPLQAGCTYNIEFYVKPWKRLDSVICYPFIGNSMFIDRIGGCFSNGNISPAVYIDKVNSPVTNYSPHVLSPHGVVLNNLSAWTLVQGIYTATGGEDRFTIGSFDTSVNVIEQYNSLPSPSLTYSALYQIDDVSVTPVNSPPPINLGNDTTICRGQPFSKILDAGAAHGPYLWSTGETTQTIIITQPGTYWVKGSGQCSCNEDTITVYEVDPLTKVLGNDTALCPSAFPYTITPVTTLAGYLWNTGATSGSLTVTAPGIYWLETHTPCGLFRDSIIITYQPFPVILDLGKDTAICAGSSLTLRGDNHFTAFQWNTGSAADSISVQSQGWYVLQATDDCGTQTDSVYITVVPLPPPPVARDTSVCLDDPSPFLQVNGADLLWYENITDTQGSTTQPVIATDKAGVVTVYVTQNTNGCESVKVGVNVTVLPIDTIVRTDTLQSCVAGGFSIPLLPAGAGRYYQWNTGDTTAGIMVQDTGRYWTNARIGCDRVRDTIYIMYREPLPLRVSNDTVICAGSYAVLSGNKGFDSYLWSTGAATDSIRVNRSGYYSLTVTDFCGSRQDSVLVTVLPLSAPPATRDTMICRYSGSPLLPVDGLNLLWYQAAGDDNGQDAQPQVNTAIPGFQTFYVTQNINGCESEKASLTLEVMSAPEISLSPDTLICYGTTGRIGFENPPGSYLYTWNTGEVTPVIVPQSEGVYTVTATNDCGEDTASIRVAIKGCTDCLYAPGVFSPNDDGKNDLFRVGVRCPVFEYSLRIYNRWGQMVYETGQPGAGWDGRYKGRDSDMGSYYYVVHYRLSAVTGLVVLKGEVTLVR